MKIVYRYLIKKFLGPFVLTFFFALFILLMQFLWKYVDELVGKGLDLSVILKLLFYASATFVPMAIPLAVLLSSLMTFGNLGERYELVALKSAGISISKLMKPLAFLSLIICGLSFWFSNNVMPIANLKMRMTLYDIREQKPALSIEEGVFYNGIEGYIIRVGKKDSDNETIRDVLIYDHSHHHGNTTMTYAKSGSMTMTADKKYFLFTLYDGFYWDETVNQSTNDAKFPLTRAVFKKQYKRFDLSSFEIQKADESFFRTGGQFSNVKVLSKEIDSLKTDLKEVMKAAPNTFFNNLYFFNLFVKNDTTNVIIPDSGKIYSIEEMPYRRQQEVFNISLQSSENFSNSIEYAFSEVNYKNIFLWATQIEFHRKFTLSLACFLFFFIGAPLGSIIRKGGIAVPLVVTVLFFAFYFVISIIGEKVSRGSNIPVVLGMWMSSAILLPICIFLTHKASIDSAVLSNEWIVKLKKITKVFKRSKKKKR